MWSKRKETGPTTELSSSLMAALVEDGQTVRIPRFISPLGLTERMFEPSRPIPFPSRRDLTVVEEVDLGGLDRDLARKVAEVFGYQTPLRAIADKEGEARLVKVLKDLDIRPFMKAEVKAYKAAQVVAKSSKYQTAHWEQIPLGQTVKKFANFGDPAYDYQYTHPIPQYALHTALQVKKACPEAEIGIEYLNVQPIDPFLYVRLAKAIEYIEVWDEADFNGKRQA